MDRVITNTSEESVPVGELLRYWRGHRGWSQLDLALEGNVSQRHVSFVESGRSVPSRGLLITLSEVLNIPLRERNDLFLAAGYAPKYRDEGMDDATMKVVSDALDQMLRNHEPNPAILMDRYWNVITTNSAARTLLESLMKLDAFPKPRNLLEVMFHPDGLRSSIENWEVVAAGLLERVRREALGAVVDPRLKTLLKKLQDHVAPAKLPAITNSSSPVLPLTFLRGDERLSYFSLVTTVSTPQTVAAQELRLECMFPIASPKSAPPAHSR